MIDRPLRFARGHVVGISGTDRRCIITQIINSSRVGVRDVDGGQPPEEVDAVLLTDDPGPANPTALTTQAPAPNAGYKDLTQITEAAWKTARRRLEAIKPLIGQRAPASLVRERARQYGCHPATLYEWMKRYRNSSGMLDALLDWPRSVPKGTKKLPALVEAILREVIEQRYLTPQRERVGKIYEALRIRFDKEGIAPELVPHVNTIRRRVLEYAGRRSDLARLGPGAASKYQATGEGFVARFPLEYVEIDHTRVDVMLIDPVTGYKLGRPYITVAIDVFSRMIVGYYIAFEAPGALATGICVSQAILPKNDWLREHASFFQKMPEWPCHGLPTHLHMDNGKDFRGEMIRRACERYPMNVDFRPVRKPWFGSHVESYLGKFAIEVSSLPGATFSNPVARGKHYDSEAQAVLSFRDFECWVANYICCVYHYRIHSALGKSPLDRWHQGWSEGSELHPPLGSLPALYTGESAQRLKLDFLPFIEHKIREDGVVFNKIHYMSPVLRPWIRAMDPSRPGKRREFLFRYDPRDLSYLYFLNPDTDRYEKIPYRDISRPKATLWERNAASEYLAKQCSTPKGMQDEAMIFTAIKEMRQRVDAAAIHKGKLKPAGRVRPGVHDCRLPDRPSVTSKAQNPQSRASGKEAKKVIEITESYDDLDAG